MYTFSAVWWSLFTAASAVAQGFASLFGFRLLLGIGESPAYPSNVKATGEWFPKQERGLATGIYDSGSRAGTAAAAPIVAGLVALIGWRGSFVVTGLVWAVAWALFYRRPREHSRASAAEIEYIEAGQDRGSSDENLPRIRWIDLLRYRAVWGMIPGNFCIGFVIYWFVTWFPSYLVDDRGFNLLQVGIYAALPALVAIPTGWLRRGPFGGQRCERNCGPQRVHSWWAARLAGGRPLAPHPVSLRGHRPPLPLLRQPQIGEHLVLSEEDLGASNTAENPTRVYPRPGRGAEVTEGRLWATLPPLSWNVLHLGRKADRT